MTNPKPTFSEHFLPPASAGGPRSARQLDRAALPPVLYARCLSPATRTPAALSNRSFGKKPRNSGDHKSELVTSHDPGRWAARGYPLVAYARCSAGTALLARGPKQPREDGLSYVVASQMAAAMDDAQQPVQWEQWGAVMAEADCLQLRSGKGWRLFLRLLPQGVPAPLRGKVWQELSGATAAGSGPPHRYARLLGRRSAAEEQIMKDVPRTLPHHELFRERSGHGQTALFNVSKGFALHDEEVGYCQGIANVAAMLLIANSMDEEAAFSTLCVLMSSPSYGPLRRQYVPGMPMLQLRMWQLEKLLALHLPRLSAHLSSLGILPTTFASEWFLTLFAYNWPTPWVARVWDLFLVHGTAAIFAAALAVCILAEAECCAAPAASATAATTAPAQAGRTVAACWDFERTVALLRRGIATRCAHTMSGDAEISPDAEHVASRLLESMTTFLSSLGGQKALAKLEREYHSAVTATGGAEQGQGQGQGTGTGHGHAAEAQPEGNITGGATAVGNLGALRWERTECERELAAAKQRKQQLSFEIRGIQEETSEMVATHLPALRAQLTELKDTLKHTSPPSPLSPPEMSARTCAVDYTSRSARTEATGARVRAAGMLAADGTTPPPPPPRP